MSYYAHSGSVRNSRSNARENHHGNSRRQKTIPAIGRKNEEGGATPPPFAKEVTIETVRILRSSSRGYKLKSLFLAVRKKLREIGIHISRQAEKWITRIIRKNFADRRNNRIYIKPYLRDEDPVDLANTIIHKICGVVPSEGSFAVAAS